jgi:peptidoglycan/LPS O-acetylase OafA/YrhL
LAPAREAERARVYIPQLDGLRFFAFLAVFVTHASRAAEEIPPDGGLSWYHAEWWGRSALISGSFGVDLFFLLSAYLITWLLVREAVSRGRIHVAAFWMRRILRIWPLYFGFLIAYTLIGGMSARMLGAFSMFIGNWALVAWNEPIGLARPLWSVSVEEQFYLTWPLLLAAVPRRLLQFVCVAMMATAVATRFVRFSNGIDAISVWLSTFAHLDAFGLGALIALQPRPRLSPGTRGAVAVASVLALVACAGVLSFALVDPATHHVPRDRALAATLVLLAAIIACGGVLSAALAGSEWLARPGLAYLGRISYGSYVFHTSAVGLVASWGWLARFPVALALTVGAAALSYHYFECPFLRLKRRFTYVGPH